MRSTQWSIKWLIVSQFNARCIEECSLAWIMSQVALGRTELGADACLPSCRRAQPQPARALNQLLGRWGARTILSGPNFRRQTKRRTSTKSRRTFTCDSPFFARAREVNKSLFLSRAGPSGAFCFGTGAKMSIGKRGSEKTALICKHGHGECVSHAKSQ